jgi:hypothetical protein
LRRRERQPLKVVGIVDVPGIVLAESAHAGGSNEKDTVVSAVESAVPLDPPSVDFARSVDPAKGPHVTAAILNSLELAHKL